VTLTKTMVDAFMTASLEHPTPGDVILIPTPQYAGMRALVEFAGRDHRRLKREFNKAWRKARKAMH